jgi:uncharacterized repeat protein (TIGR03803 family)
VTNQTRCSTKVLHMTKNPIRDLFAIAMLALALTFVTTVVNAQTYTVLHNFDSARGIGPEFPALLAQGRDGNLYGTTTEGGTNNVGVAFKITPAGTFNVLYNFDITHGSTPFGGLTLGTDGNFYGTATYGGTSGFGNVFKMTASGSLTVLYNFTHVSDDGGYPYAPPIQGTDGNFYGATYYARAYKLAPSGVLTVIHTDGSSYGPLVQGTDGQFYGTTQDGGSYLSGSVFKLNAADIYNFDGIDSANPYGGLVQGPDGNFYGTASSGGSLGGGIVFKLSPGGKLTVLHEFDSTNTAGGFDPIAGLVYATDGNFYGVAAAGGTAGYGVIFKIANTPTATYTVLHNFNKTDGWNASATPMQHTNGKIYGLTSNGGANDLGVSYSLDLGLKPFAKLTSTVGVVGNSVGILGQGFTGATAVEFNGAAATFKIVSDTYLTATVPSAATTGSVTVTTRTSSLNSNQTFRLTPKILSFNPISGPVGTPVIITGNSLTQTTKVTVGGAKATSFIVNSNTQVTVTVPTGAKTGRIVITTPGGTATSATSFTVTP